MALMKKKVRNKLNKYLSRLVKKHGGEMALALVSGIISSLAADRASKTAKAGKKARADQVARAEKKMPAGRLAKAPARPVVVRKRAVR